MPNLVNKLLVTNLLFLFLFRSQNLPSSIRISAGNFFSRLQPSSKASNVETTASALLASSTNREELLRLFILKLEEESNYFDSSPSPEEELCECSKCQVGVHVCLASRCSVVDVIYFFWRKSGNSRFLLKPKQQEKEILKEINSF